eukprot:c28556_g1_i5 orf=424-2244(-)
MSERDEVIHSLDVSQAARPQSRDRCPRSEVSHDRGSSNAFGEDEMVAWIHYPLYDSFEKPYCSDLFGQWPLSDSQAYKDQSSTANSHSVSAIGCIASSHLIGNEGHASIVGDAGTAVDSSVQRLSNADAALALGAGRAAGLIAQVGSEAFSKVRISVQSESPKLCRTALALPKDSGSFSALSTSSSRYPLEKASSTWPSLMLPPRSRHFCSSSGRSSLQTTQGEIKDFVDVSLPSVIDKGGPCGSGMVPDSKSTIRHQPNAKAVVSSCADSSLADPSATFSLSGDGLRKESRKHSLVLPTGNNLSSEKMTAIPIKTEVAQATLDGSGLDMGLSRTNNDTVCRVKSSVIGFSGSEKRTDGGHEVVMTTYSEGSQTSAEKSLKEAVSSGKRKSEDSECHSEDAEGESAETKHPLARTKRSRAAEIHNLSERRRRDRINEKMKALQELIPNSNKTDKASMLDEAIEYLKMLQLQLQMMSVRSGMSIPPMMLPSGMPHMQMPRMTPLHPMGMGVNVATSAMGMGMGLGMGVGMVDIGHGIPGRPFYCLPSLPDQIHNMPSANCSTSSATNSDVCFQGSTMVDSSPIYISYPQSLLTAAAAPSTTISKSQS